MKLTNPEVSLVEGHRFGWRWHRTAWLWVVLAVAVGVLLSGPAVTWWSGVAP